VKRKLNIFLGMFILLGYLGQVSSQTTEIGEFVMAGPISANAPELSMRWQYGLRLGFDPKTISEIKFSCEPIPGTTFTAIGAELKILKNGVVSADGPVVPISKESTPWLFENSTTSARCRAVISRPDKADASVSAPVSFPPSQKLATFQQFKMAHEFNSSLKK
jgi:hypothetical protein